MTTPHIEVCLGGVVIGTTTDVAYDSMGVLFGAFHPTAAYTTVQSVFFRFADGETARYYRERDALDLSARVQPGGHALPVDVVHIVDFSRELGVDGLELEVLLSEPLSEAVWTLLALKR